MEERGKTKTNQSTNHLVLLLSPSSMAVYSEIRTVSLMCRRNICRSNFITDFTYVCTIHSTRCDHLWRQSNVSFYQSTCKDRGLSNENERIFLIHRQKKKQKRRNWKKTMYCIVGLLFIPQRTSQGLRWEKIASSLVQPSMTIKWQQWFSKKLRL